MKYSIASHQFLPLLLSPNSQILVAFVHRYILASSPILDNNGNHTNRYLYNLYGSSGRLAGVRNMSEMLLAMIPHPERTVLQEAVSYKSAGRSGGCGGVGPWVRTFRSPRRLVR